MAGGLPSPAPRLRSEGTARGQGWGPKGTLRQAKVKPDGPGPRGAGGPFVTVICPAAEITNTFLSEGLAATGPRALMPPSCGHMGRGGGLGEGAGASTPRPEGGVPAAAPSAPPGSPHCSLWPPSGAGLRLHGAHPPRPPSPALSRHPCLHLPPRASVSQTHPRTRTPMPGSLAGAEWGYAFRPGLAAQWSLHGMGPERQGQTRGGGPGACG